MPSSCLSNAAGTKAPKNFTATCDKRHSNKSDYCRKLADVQSLEITELNFMISLKFSVSNNIGNIYLFIVSNKHKHILGTLIYFQFPISSMLFL